MILDRVRPDHIRRTILISIALLFTGYQAVNVFVPNGDMILAVRVLAAGFYVTVLYIYGPDAWHALVTPTPKRTDFLVVGIWVSFASHLGQTLYAIVYRLAPSPWLLNSEVVSPIVLLSVIGAVLHVSAPGGLDGVVPRRNRIALGVGVGAATCMVALLFFTRPDIGPIIERTRPYIGDFWKTGGLFGGPDAG